jgi:cell wall-associated NlpC family hydrolase
MLKKLLVPTLLCSFSMLEAQECKIDIKAVKHNSTELTLVVTHSQNCEILIENNISKIVLTSTDSNSTYLDNSIKIDKLITLAKSKIGSTYKHAQAGPDTFDCSGFVYYIFKQSGVKIPRTSLKQSQIGKKLTKKELEVGDLLSFDTSLKGHINHSGIYLGDGKFIHASSGKAKGVTISDLNKGFYVDKFRWGTHIDLK